MTLRISLRLPVVKLQLDEGAVVAAVPCSLLH